MKIKSIKIQYLNELLLLTEWSICDNIITLTEWPKIYRGERYESERKKLVKPTKDNQ